MNILRRQLKLLAHPYVLVVAVFLLAVLLINPWGEHAVNDDWAYFISTKFFLNGHFAKDAIIDANFVLQALAGMGWAKVFGVSFVSFRVLTLLVSLVGLYGIYKILAVLEVERKIIILALLSIVFNTLFFTSALSYMTENYFLTCVVWSLYFFVRYVHTIRVNSHLIFSALFAGASLLLRQYGLVLFVAYGLTLGFCYWKNREINPLAVTVLIGILGLFSVIFAWWPKTSGYESVTFLGVDPTAYTKIYEFGPYVLSYLVLFLSPFILGKFKGFQKTPLVLCALVAGLVAWQLYRADIFPMGNVFYLEKLYGKSHFAHFLHLFDNIPFKVFMAYYVSFLLVVSSYYVTRWFRSGVVNLKVVSPSTFLLALVTLGMFAVVYAGIFFIGDFYDRYFLNGFVLLIILCAVSLPKVSTYSYGLAVGGLVFIAFITVLLTWDFYASEKTRWQMGRKLQEEQGLQTSVFVNGSFLRFTHYSGFVTPEELARVPQGSVTYKCFIDFYTKTDNANLLYKVLNRFENSRTLNKYITNPVIYGSKPAAGVEPLGWHWNDIFYEESYYSPIYALLGVKPVLAAYCRDK